MTDGPELLSLDQAAALAGLTRRKIKRLIYISALLVAQEDSVGEPLISRTELMRFLQSGQLRNIRFPDRAAQRERAIIAKLEGKAR